MNNKDTKRGFSGLSDLASDIETLPQSEPGQTSSQPSAPQKAVFALLELTKWPSLPAPWSSIDAGETWVWGDFLLTFQNKPKTVLDVTMEMQGRKAEHRGITYHYAMSVFYRIDRNPHGPMHRPIMVVGLEQANIGLLTKMLGSETGDLLQAGGGREMGPLMVGLFTAETRYNLGRYEGDTSSRAVKRRFFEILGPQLGVSGEPKMIGDLAQAHGHPETARPARENALSPSPPIDDLSSRKRSGGSGGKWIPTIIGVVFIIGLVSMVGQSKREPAVKSSKSPQSYSLPQTNPARDEPSYSPSRSPQSYSFPQTSPARDEPSYSPPRSPQSYSLPQTNPARDEPSYSPSRSPQSYSFPQTSPARDGEAAVVSAIQLNVRSGPGTANEVVFKLSQDEPVRILERRILPNGDGWGRITSAGGTGWVNIRLVRVEPPGVSVPTSTNAAWVNTTQVNVRKGPGPEYPALEELPRDTRVDVLEQQRIGPDATWARIRVGSLTGWINAKLLRQ